MILEKMFTAVRAFFNGIANAMWERNPIAIMQLQYDKSVEQLQEGRKGLELYRGLVERVSRQVAMGKAQVDRLTAEVKAYLKAGDRETAGKFALQLKKAEADLATNADQLKMHEDAYENNLKKIQFANKQLGEVREKIQRYNADLKMSAAEAEIAKIAGDLNMDVTTDFGQVEQIIQQQIDNNRGKARVAADLSSRGVAEVKAQERMESQMAEDTLQQFEVELGLKSPDTTPVVETKKELGPATDTTASA
jgi:phage shock protein A